MRGLSKTYEGRLDVIIGSATSKEGLAAKERNGWESRQHGLECVAPDGTVVGQIPGHDYGEKEILEKVEALLAACEAPKDK